MIVSHRHKFIFLKTSKTAGTSLELALAKFCGEDDIITPVSPVDEQLREELGVRGPQNFERSLRSYRAHDWLRTAMRLRRQKIYNHMPAREVRRLLKPEMWDQYFKFCFERNPWDRVLSQYAWRCQTEPKPSMAEFLKSKAVRDLTKRGIEVYTIRGQVVVDRICRYENLSEELAFLEQRLGLPGPIEMPRAKAGHRRDRRHYRDVLSDEAASQIAQKFGREIELLGYTY
jgi:hypothetical protein